MTISITNNQTRDIIKLGTDYPVSFEIGTFNEISNKGHYKTNLIGIYLSGGSVRTGLGVNTFCISFV